MAFGVEKVWAVDCRYAVTAGLSTRLNQDALLGLENALGDPWRPVH